VLQRLQIHNFALIDKLDITFPGELSVITGETGSGKSIFIEAFSLVLGQRADSSTIRKGAKKCIIEAAFLIKGLGLELLFEEMDLEFEEVLTLRREISTDGKSRCFVNDALVNVTALKKLGERLVDIHSQHQTLLLNQAAFQINLLDAFAKNNDRLIAYKKTFKAWQQTVTRLEALKALEQQSLKEQDYIQFQLEELNELQLKPGLLKSLEEEVLTWSNAGTIRESLSGLTYQLNGHEGAVIHTLARLRQSLQVIAKYGPAYKEMAERLHTTVIELKDLVNTSENEEGKIQTNDKQLELLSSKLDHLNRVMKKHGAQNDSDLMAIKTAFELKLNQFLSASTEIKQLTQEADSLLKSCKQQASTLSKTRQEAVIGLNKSVKQLLGELSLPHAVFEVDIQPLPIPGPDGADTVQFLFSANKGLPLQDIRKTASGGELSRLMLCLKSILARTVQLPTIIFDEIDSGVSGIVAEQIGRLLAESGKMMQVIAITHLPQLASKGSHHLYVYKTVEGDATTSRMRELSKDERKHEIAQMLSTGKPTNTALKNAEELLAAANRMG